MIEAAFWGMVGGSALIVGALLGLYAPISQRLLASIMAFGSGVLIAALAFELADEAFTRGGTDALALGMVGGALMFSAGNWVIERRGGKDRKRAAGQQKEGAAMAIVLGAALDGVPESIVVGTSLLEGTGVSAAIVVAVFLSNVPESLSAAVGLKKAGRSARWILGLWGMVAVSAGLSSMLGYGLLDDASGNTIGLIQAFAAGAILTMLVDTMIPEAYDDGGAEVGVVTVFGFALAYLLSHVGG